MKVTPKQFAQTLYDLTDGKPKAEAEKLITGFVAYVNKNRKLKLADKIVEQFEKIYNREKEIIEAEVVTRKNMGDAELKKIKKFVKEKYAAKEVVLKNTVDGSVSGGFILKVGDDIVDGSVRGRLLELRKVLIK